MKVRDPGAGGGTKQSVLLGSGSSSSLCLWIWVLTACLLWELRAWFKPSARLGPAPGCSVSRIPYSGTDLNHEPRHCYLSPGCPQ